MRKLLLLAAMLCFSSHALNSQSTAVYISTGKSAYAYHRTKSCPSLRKCVQEGHVRTVTLEEAVRMKRKPCGKCYK